MRFRSGPLEVSLLGVALLLSIFGLLMIYSGSSKLAFNQLIFLILGVGAFLFIKQIDYRVYQKILPQLYIGVLLLLVSLSFLGTEIRGSMRWFDLGFFRLQPSELVKPLLILVLAGFASQKNLSSLKYFLASMFIIGLPALLVLRQPDIGSSLVIVAIWLAIILVSPVKLWHVASVAFFFLAFLPVIYQFLAPYQKGRVMAFINPSHDPLGVGYSVIQSQIAIGSGQLVGRGFGHGTQSHLRFLPEFNTDFIFATLAEELGLVGAVLLLGTFTVLLIKLLQLARRISDPFGANIVMGVVGVILAHLAINIGMNLGLLPVTGITLPFISYGGSSLVSTFIMLGLVASVERYAKKLVDS